MSSYRDLIKQEGEYTYSANIQFDIESDSKLLRYIPNETSIKLFKEYFSDMMKDNSSNHSRILYGSYGTGKSHFLTVFGQILNKAFTTGVAYSTFISRINEFDNELATDINNYVLDETRKPYLIVPIVFDFDDFDRCIYFSLKKKVESIGITINYKTFFSQATALLNQWKSSDESLTRLNEIAKENNVKLDMLESKLDKLNPKAEKNFNMIFEAMTYGVKYVYEASNMAEILNQTNEAISEDYSGIVFIFDEFGRYIEDNLKTIKVKAVQNFAEYCDHCKGNNHIILVSHKELSQYTEHYGKNISDEWKKVEGRYKSDSINTKQDQCLEIIRSVLIKNEPAWSIFAEKYRLELINLYNSASDFRGFSVSAIQDKNPYEVAFPLHPLALFSLDRLSKKVAQNDRTFFTFLASIDADSLYTFLIKHELDEFHFVGINEIYDYYEPNIKAVQSNEIYNWYKMLQAALSKGQFDEYDNPIEVKVLKSIAVIGIINDTSVLCSDKQTLITAIDEDNYAIEAAMAGLVAKKIIKYSGVYNRYEFFDASIFDIDEMIENESLRVSDDSMVQVLNDIFVKFVLYPHEYNHTFKINRVFIPVFLTEDALDKKTFLSRLGSYYDGTLIMVIGNCDSSLNHLKDCSAVIDRSIIWLNKESENLIKNVKKFISVKYLDTQKKIYVEQDPAFEKELAYHNQELYSSIENEINEWIRFNSDCDVISNCQILTDCHSFEQISSIASEIMFRVYSNTLIVNNELINKNVVSASIVSAKKNAVRAILTDDMNRDYYGLQYLSPDYIAVRSVLSKNGFVDFNENLVQNSIDSNLYPQTAVKKLLDGFVEKAKKNDVSFADVYKIIKQPPFGLRDGYLSLLFACVLRDYKKSLTINSHGAEQEITPELFEEIFKRPKDFTFSVVTWSKDELEYISGIEKLFIDTIDETSFRKNRLKAIYDGMLSHYKALPKFARSTNRYISDNAASYRKIMKKSYTNYSLFFFKEMKSVTGDFESCFNYIKNCKEELNNALSLLNNDLKSIIYDVLNINNATTLASGIQDAYNKKLAEKRAKSFDYYTNAFLEFISKINKSYDDEVIISQIGKIFSGIETYYWNDSHRDEFENKFRETYNKLASYVVTDKLQKSETRMTITAPSGTEKSVVFDNTDLSDMALTIKNKINSTFSNFGLAVSYEDKVQILLSLINDLMEGK